MIVKDLKPKDVLVTSKGICALVVDVVNHPGIAITTVTLLRKGQLVEHCALSYEQVKIFFMIMRVIRDGEIHVIYDAGGNDITHKHRQ